jgi:nucleoprotein TPR
MRGGAGIRAGRGGVPGTRGRGGGGRGGLNATAQNFSPPGQAGQKRPREEGSIGGPQQGNGGKRARGGGQSI